MGPPTQVKDSRPGGISDASRMELLHSNHTRSRESILKLRDMRQTLVFLNSTSLTCATTLSQHLCTCDGNTLPRSGPDTGRQRRDNDCTRLSDMNQTYAIISKQHVIFVSRQFLYALGARHEPASNFPADWWHEVVSTGGLTGSAEDVRAIVRYSSLVNSVAPVVKLAAIHSPLQ